jgi:hypothetical protein
MDLLMSVFRKQYGNKSGQSGDYDMTPITMKYYCDICKRKHYFCPEEVVMVVENLKIRRRDFKAFQAFVRKTRG